MSGLISIVSPVYNDEKYLKQFLDSIKKQTYTNYEVLLIDDGSIDNSKKIIAEYVKSDNRFHYFYQTNKGAPAARNLGISKATGKYLYIPDSDDLLCPNTLKIFMDGFKEENVDIVLGNYDTVDENGHKILTKNQTFMTPINYELKTDFMFCCPFPGNKCFRLDMVKKSKVTFQNLKIAQDANFYLRILPFARKIKFVNDKVFNYRIVPNSISHQYTLKIFDIANSMFLVYNDYKKMNLDQIYFDNLELLKLNYYYFQFSKIIYYKGKDKNEVYKFFKNNFYTLKVKNTSNFYRFKKRYIAYLLRIYLGFIFNNYYIYKIFKGVRNG